MPADVRVRVIAEDRISSVLSKIDASLGKMGGNMKGFFNTLGKQSYNDISGTMGKLRDVGQQMKDIGRAAAEAALPIAMVGGAVVGVGAAMKKSADYFEAYANQVSDMMDIIGGSPEEISKLIQVADDVRISFETLKTAMVGAVRKGVDPSIEGLARLADAYNKLPEGAQRTKFLLDSFGRSGAEMARMMELGAEGIIKLGQAYAGTSLEISKDDTASALAYHNAVDDVTDSIEKLKVSAGKASAPIIVKVITNVQENIDYLTASNEFYQKLDKALKAGAIDRTDNAYKYIMDSMADGVEGVADATEILKAKWTEFYMELGLTSDVIKSIADGMDMVGTAGEDAANRGAEAWDNYKQAAADAAGKEYWEKLWGGIDKTDSALGDLGDTADDTGKKLEDMFNFKIPDISGDIKGMMGGMKWDEIGGAEFEETFKAEMKRLYEWAPEGSLAMDTFAGKADAVFAALQAKMGELSEEDAIQKIADALGLSADQAKTLYEALMKMDGLQLQAWFTLYQTTVTRNPRTGAGTYDPSTGTYTTPGGDTYTTKATGGPVYGGRGYMVGEQGPELFFPRSTGDIVPADKTAAMMNGGGGQYVDITINAAPGMSPTAVAYQVVDMLAKRQSMSRMAGIGYAGA